MAVGVIIERKGATLDQYDPGFPGPPEITLHDVHNYDSADGPA
jgi:hypothetical protein